ncbi:MAG: endo-1,4-beta-xylanase [Bacteroidales bacterium]|nr:endo-1,4-beta-xylanase [Bacteroidales bacterium]
MKYFLHQSVDKAKQGFIPVSLFFMVILSVLSFTSFAQTYPPSCVVTMPFANAYFKENSDIVIKVYSTDIGKTSNNGTVTKVEFYNGTTKLGETATHTSNTYTFTWKCVAAGKHTIKAVATNSNNVKFTSAGVVINVGTANVTARGLSANKGKYLANIIAGSANNDYNTLWNGVTAENGCKWGSVEGTRNTMSWGQADISYNHAKNNNLMFRYHAIAWGSQYPNWITSLSVADFKAEMEQYMTLVAARYEYMDQIDVLNEQIGTHASGTGYFRDGLGGNGTTGFDWQIWLFEKARQHFPNSKLVLNDYGLENDQNAINQMLNLVKALRDRGLIDGFGTQAHCFNVDGVSTTALKSALDLMDNGGVPIYVTELDLNGGVESASNESQQKSSYEARFPIYWDHPAVAGITLWGYVDGATWKTGTGILSSSRADKQAMTWLKSYMTARPNVSYPFGTIAGTCAPSTDPVVEITAPTAATPFASPASITITATASDPNGTISKVEFYNGEEKLGEDASSPYSYSWTSVAAGTYTLTAVATDNDGNKTTSGALAITVTAPALNGTIVINAMGVVGDETIELEVDGVVVDTWTLTTAFANYTATGNVNGVIRVNYTNDDGADRDAEIDYITVAGTKYEAEDQAINTGYYANGACGGGGNSQLMHCSGYIEFVTEPVNTVDECPNDPNKTAPGTCGCGVADTDTDKDGTADCLDTDDDGDGIVDASDCDPINASVGAKTKYYADADNDGFGDAATMQEACAKPVGYVTNSTDACPADVNKTQPGNCGCGVAEGTCTVQTVSLKAGWNLIGCPILTDTELQKALSSIWSYVLTVKDQSGFYQVNNPVHLNSLKVVSWGSGYLVNVSQSCTLDWIVR